MDYTSLAVSEGTDAQVAWSMMIRLSGGEEKSKLIDDLKQYCGQDTLAMVEIHKVLSEGASHDQ